jgi:hypothetical protein
MAVIANMTKLRTEANAAADIKVMTFSLIASLATGLSAFTEPVERVLAFREQRAFSLFLPERSKSTAAAGLACNTGSFCNALADVKPPDFGHRRSFLSGSTS